MASRIAILDLGTNTFHLLIIEVKESRHEVLFKIEKFVKLAEESIHHIGEQAFARGINLLKEYKEVINQHQPEKVFAFGTAALRNANNADEFIQAVKDETGIEVKRISGDEEATLIYKGVRQAVELTDEPALIMDIGGGSTEFIIANKNEIFWKQSFPVGASVLKQGFHQTEPITAEEKKTLVTFLKKELAPLFAQRTNYRLTHLVGASGSFDSYASMIAHQYYTPDILEGKTCFAMKPEEVNAITATLEKADWQQRLKTPGMLAFRAEMIVVAAILTEVILQYFPIILVTQSGYALKEGVVAELTA